MSQKFERLKTLLNEFFQLDEVVAGVQAADLGRPENRLPSDH